MNKLPLFITMQIYYSSLASFENTINNKKLYKKIARNNLCYILVKNLDTDPAGCIFCLVSKLPLLGI